MRALKSSPLSPRVPLVFITFETISRPRFIHSNPPRPSACRAAAVRASRRHYPSAVPLERAKMCEKTVTASYYMAM